MSSENQSGNNALVVGATSSLAQALCRVLAKRGYSLTLAGRDEEELQLLASDIAVRFGSECRLMRADLAAPDFSPEECVALAGEFDSLILATGDMGNGDNRDLVNLSYVTHLNYTVPAQLAAAAAEQMAARGGGTIVVISSVAGDRGRQSNYAYGSAKAALSTFASGLRNRYAKERVHVLTVKPGFVDTPMTWGMKSPLIAARESVAETIARAMKKKKNVIYTPFFWRFIMLIIRHIPEPIFKRLKL